jgi:hypothetical protein
MTQFQMCPGQPRNQRRNPFAVHRTFSGTPPNADAADAYEHILTIQNAADLEFPATDPANAPARAEFKLGIFHSAFFIHNSAFASRHRQFIKDFLDDRFAGFFLGLGFVGDGHAVAQHVHACQRV